MREKVRRSCTIFFTRCVPSRLRESSLLMVSRMRSVSVVRALALDELLDVLVEQLEVRVHEADRIVELVGDAGDELAERLHLLRLRELRLDVAQLARALLDARFERLVQLRDLVEGLGVLDRDRALVRERAQQQAVVRGQAVAGELAPDGDHAEQVDAVEDGDEQLDLERVEDVAAGLAALEIVLVVEIDAREILAPHPQVLPDRMVGGDLDLERLRRPNRRARRSAAAALPLSSTSSTIARSTPIVSVSATRMRSAISPSDSIETIASEISRTATR